VFSFFLKASSLVFRVFPVGLVFLGSFDLALGLFMEDLEPSLFFTIKQFLFEHNAQDVKGLYRLWAFCTL
jgi:hypothetical protein